MISLFQDYWTFHSPSNGKEPSSSPLLHLPKSGTTFLCPVTVWVAGYAVGICVVHDDVEAGSPCPSQVQQTRLTVIPGGPILKWISRVNEFLLWMRTPSPGTVLPQHDSSQLFPTLLSQGFRSWRPRREELIRLASANLPLLAWTRHLVVN